MLGEDWVIRKINGEMRKIVGVSFEKAENLLLKKGFVVVKRSQEIETINLERRGTIFTTDSAKFPLCIQLCRSADNLVMIVNYDALVLFDTGNLIIFADDLAATLGKFERI